MPVRVHVHSNAAACGFACVGCFAFAEPALWRAELCIDCLMVDDGAFGGRPEIICTN